MQKLPKAIAPNVRYAERLHRTEKDLYVGHWMRAKKALENGTGLVRTGSPFFARQPVVGLVC
jgi:hypothetical protein